MFKLAGGELVAVGDLAAEDDGVEHVLLTKLGRCRLPWGRGSRCTTCASSCRGTVAAPGTLSRVGGVRATGGLTTWLSAVFHLAKTHLAASATAVGGQLAGRRRLVDQGLSVSPRTLRKIM